MKTTRSIILPILILFNYLQIYSQENIITPFEKSKGQETTTYFEGIEFYMQLADQYELTYLETHPKKLGDSLGNLISEKLSPSLENKKQFDQDFRRNSRAQLDFIYRNSKYFEENYRQYPVYRILK